MTNTIHEKLDLINDELLVIKTKLSIATWIFSFTIPIVIGICSTLFVSHTNDFKVINENVAVLQQNQAIIKEDLALLKR